MADYIYLSMYNMYIQRFLKFLFKKHHITYISWQFFNIKFVRFTLMDLYSLVYSSSLVCNMFILWMYHKFIFQLMDISDFFYYKSTTINYFNYNHRWIIDLVTWQNSGGLFKKMFCLQMFYHNLSYFKYLSMFLSFQNLYF